MRSSILAVALVAIVTGQSLAGELSLQLPFSKLLGLVNCHAQPEQSVSVDCAWQKNGVTNDIECHADIVTERGRGDLGIKATIWKTETKPVHQASSDSGRSFVQRSQSGITCRAQIPFFITNVKCQQGPHSIQCSWCWWGACYEGTADIR